MARNRSAFVEKKISVLPSARFSISGENDLEMRLGESQIPRSGETVPTHKLSRTIRVGKRSYFRSYFMWIACKDKMPEMDHKGSDYSKEVLVIAWLEGAKCWRYETAYWSTHSEEWFMDGGAQTVPHVSHWMPLPPPPQTQEK